MERRALLAVVISVAILLAYQEIVLKRMYPRRPAEEAQQAQQLAVPAGAREPEPVPPPALEEPLEEALPVAASSEEVTVETDLYRAVLAAAGGRLRSLKLKEYRASPEADSELVEMVAAGGREFPLGLEFRGPHLQGEEAISDSGAVYEIKGRPLRLSGDEQGTIVFAWRARGIDVEKRFRFTGNSYPIGLEIALRQVPEGVTQMGLKWVRGAKGVEKHYRSFAGAVALVDKKLHQRSLSKLEEKVEELKGAVHWAGYADTYFLAAIIPSRPEGTDLWLRRYKNTAEARLVVATAGESVFPFRVYAGPKDLAVLEAVDPSLPRSIDFGYFAFLSIPFLYALKLLHTLTSNYGIDIILLTLGIKILFIPLTQKSFKSMKEMQKLQPQMTRLREKLKDKPEEMQKEIMELYRRHKVNPLGGCLPMLLQFPVFIGLYNTLLSAIELRQAPFAVWITDLSQPDRLGGLEIPFVSPPGIPVLTLLMGGSMFLQQWISPAAGDPTQQRVMMIMPLMFTVIFINVPSGLVLYWLVNNVLTIAQQYAMLRAKK